MLHYTNWIDIWSRLEEVKQKFEKKLTADVDMDVIMASYTIYEHLGPLVCNEYIMEKLIVATLLRWLEDDKGKYQSQYYSGVQTTFLKCDCSCGHRYRSVWVNCLLKCLCFYLFFCSTSHSSSQLFLTSAKHFLFLICPFFLRSPNSAILWSSGDVSSSKLFLYCHLRIRCVIITLLVFTFKMHPLSWYLVWTLQPGLISEFLKKFHLCLVTGALRRFAWEGMLSDPIYDLLYISFESFTRLLQAQWITTS